MNAKIFKPIMAIIAILLAAVSVTSQQAERMFIMENDVATRKIAVSGIDSITFQNPYPATDEGVVINGVKWATRNVATPGRFTMVPEDGGRLYKWNNKTVCWIPAGNVTNWDGNTNRSDIWEKSNDPSPAGWRVPDPDDMNKLLDTDKVSSEWTTENEVYGRKFTDKATGNSMFLPAGGYRNSSGEITSARKYGRYWSNTSITNNYGYINYAYIIVINGSEAPYADIDQYISLSAQGGITSAFSIRPVAD